MYTKHMCIHVHAFVIERLRNTQMWECSTYNMHTANRIYTLHTGICFRVAVLRTFLHVYMFLCFFAFSTRSDIYVHPSRSITISMGSCLLGSVAKRCWIKLCLFIITCGSVFCWCVLIFCASRFKMVAYMKHMFHGVSFGNITTTQKRWFWQL